MWDLNTIVRMNDEAQRRADAIREYGARERQTNEPKFAGTVIAIELACSVSQEDDPHQAA